MFAATMSRAPLLTGLIYNASLRGDVGDSKKGILYYDGSAAGFEVWNYRVQVKLGAMNSIQDAQERDQKLVEFGSYIVEGLSDEALLIAIDLGVNTLNTPTGVKQLVDKMRESIREAKDDEISELYRLGAQTTGPLIRQRGEPMQSYISRRKRWWTRIRELDSSFNVSETLLADYLLDCAGLTKDQRLMILTVTGNVRTQSAIEDALRKQHSRTHESEGSSGFTSRTSAPSTGADWGGRSKGRFGRRSSGNPRRKTAFVAEGEEEDDDDDEEDEEEEEEDNQPVCYTCVTSGEDQDFENVKDRIEIDVVTAFICAGHDVEDEMVCR